MGADRPALFSRDEVLGGLPARRASTLLFAIEARTAQLAARSRAAMATWATERAEAERERTFLEALAAGRAPARRPRVQDLERYAPAWATLVPPDPQLRVAIAKLLGDKYRLPRGGVPRIQGALGLDEAAMRGITVERLTLRERLAWLRARAAERMETLPAFWTAFGLTFTEMVGGGLLGLPIALAGAGALVGLVLLVVFAALGMVTLAAVVEAITRDGNMRYGSAYFGRLVGSFLGRPGTAVLSLALTVFSLLVIALTAIGFGSALDAATGVPVAVWVAVLLAVDLAFLRRESLDATIASGLVIGAVNIGLVIALSLLALPHVDPANLAGAVGQAATAQTSLLTLAFGVLMACYFGHTSAANMAKVVLARDPSGRDLLRGSMLAMVAALGVYAAFFVATLGAVGPARLAAERGTPLGPLAEVAGPAVHALGSVYVILALGIGSIHFSLALANQVREFVPAARGATGRLGRPLLLAAAPTVAVYALIEAQVLTGAASFSGALAIAGTLAAPILGGVFPMLMLASARRRGDYVPAVAPRLLAHPIVVVAVAGVFLAAVLLHALVFWDGLPERLAAFGAAVATVGVAAVAFRDGAFRPRTVVEVRRDEPAGDRARFTVTDDGRPLVARVQVTDGAGTHELSSATGELGRFPTVRAAEFKLPARRGRDLKVWVHAVDRDGGTTSLPATVRLAVDGRAPTDHRITGELHVEPLEPASSVEVRLAHASAGAPT